MAAVLSPAGGIDYRMSAAEYHALPALGSSDLKRLLRSPAHYRARVEIEEEPTAAQDLGTAIHLGVFEPERFVAEVVAAPKLDRRTKAGKEAFDAFTAEHAGRLILPADDFDVARRVVDSVRAHPGARTVLSDGAPEVTLTWTDAVSGAPCKARFDWLRADGGAVDLKSARDASPAGFQRAIAQHGYAIQAAHYEGGARHVLGHGLPYWIFVAVEKEPPFAVGVYVLEREAMERAAERVAAALKRFRECERTGVWPAYSPLIEPINLPAWAL